MTGKQVLSLTLAAGLIFSSAAICRADGISYGGALETGVTYTSQAGSARTLFENKLNLKMEINGGEKQSGVVLFQYHYALPATDPPLTALLTINQAYLDLQLTDSSLLRIGRQKISWGTGFAWNPTNYIGTDKNRADLTTVYPGVDALNYELTREKASVNLLLKPDGEQGELSGWGRAAKLMFRVFRSDLSISVYQQGTANGYGADLAATIGDYTVYTELAAKTGRMFYIDGTGTLVHRREDQHYLHGILGVLRNFNNHWTVQMEYYHNQEGWSETETQNYHAYLVMGNPVPGEAAGIFADQRRNYLFAMIRKGELVDDVALTISGFWNMDDRSWMLTPMLDYRFGQNARAAVMINYCGGDDASEFGSLFDFQVIGKVTLNF